MKRKAKSRGSGGRMRLTLLLATAAALLLVPVAAASAAEVKVTIAGNGSGKVVDYGGTSTINCESPPPGIGTCTSALTEAGGAWKEEAAVGSEFAGWTVKKGIKVECGAVEVCVLSGATIELEATFKLKPDVHILIEGAGSGEVVDTGPNPAEHGTPPVHCLYTSPGPATGDCNVVHGVVSGFPAITVEEHAAPGSKFVEWVVEKGLPTGCEPVTAPACGVFALNEEFEPEEVKITAKFAALPKFNLTVTKSGSGSGTVTSSPAGINCGVDCNEEYLEGTKVTLTPAKAEGSKFVEWTGACTGSGACEVTMSEAKSVNAKFDLESESFSVTVEGEGKVECEDNGGGLGACAASYLYGHTIKVVATAAAGNNLESLSGTGSASGCSASPCSFEIKAASSVKAKFAPAAIVDSKPANVEGKVPQTTTLESTCEKVYLGEFLPGVPFDYEKTCGLIVTATGEANTLTATDGSVTDTGHLTQKPVHPYSLPQALQTKATGEGGLEFPGLEGGTFKPLTSPVTLLKYGGPVSTDHVTLAFKQPIAAHDALHSGIYAKTITLTLKQTTP